MTATKKKRAGEHVVLEGDTFLCLHCGASYKMAFPCPIGVLAAAAKAYTATHLRCQPNPAVAAEREARWKASFVSPEAWAAGRDTGTSSLTIWHVMTGHPFQPAFRPDVPHDPADFGRCHRLLAAFPAWRERLPEVAARHPRWGPIVREWGRLSALYEAALARGVAKSPELYALLQELEGEGNRHTAEKGRP